MQTSAPVETTALHLSTTIAVDVSAFFRAKVPPKPQHSRGIRELDELEPLDRPEQAHRRVSDAGDPKRVAGRVIGDPPGEGGADVGHAEPVHEQLRELEDARDESPTARSRPASPASRASSG